MNNRRTWLHMAMQPRLVLTLKVASCVFICTLTCINLSVYFWVGLSVLLPWIYTLHTVLEESPHGSLTAKPGKH